MSAVTIELDVDPVWGQDIDWEARCAAAARAVGHALPEMAHSEILVSVVMGEDEEVHALNQEWRAKAKPTNVLSFPMISREELLRAAARPGAPVMLGDIIMAHGVCKREAEEKQVALADHATHLLIHGLLHLAGFDHEDGDDEAEAMEALEIRALAALGIDDPYADRDL
ncbi:rRNA maturation RNase YbeY [Croceicoccus hydrothermalis]|uniref:rRNA maturation RNase YbeY n=1 Tax=Croceicoccus hydrothermalis TaxID=2867964 RepID=UPI001EFA7581|nr:rRNA maturation RNase YbeY [Croceicoccus hydrothermalis]